VTGGNGLRATPHQPVAYSAATSAVSGRQLGSATTPGSTRSRPSKNLDTSAWLRAVIGGPVRGQQLRHVGHGLGADVAGRVREDQVAAGRHCRHHVADQLVRPAAVRNVVQQHHQQHGDGLTEVQLLPCLVQECADVTQVGVQTAGPATRAAGQSYTRAGLAVLVSTAVDH
jgi:hypothetical protein